MLQLLIALAIGMLLITQAMQIFLSVKRSYSLQQGLARLQEKARVTATILNDMMLHAQQIKALNNNGLIIRTQNELLKLFQRDEQLMQQVGDNRVEPLVSGVAALNIEYGFVNRLTHQITFHLAKQIKQWQRVRWVRCEVILKVEGVRVEQPQQLWYRHGAWRAPDDNLYITWIVLLQLDRGIKSSCASI